MRMMRHKNVKHHMKGPWFSPRTFAEAFSFISSNEKGKKSIFPVNFLIVVASFLRHKEMLRKGNAAVLP